MSFFSSPVNDLEQMGREALEPIVRVAATPLDPKALKSRTKTPGVRKLFVGFTC